MFSLFISLFVLSTNNYYKVRNINKTSHGHFKNPFNTNDKLILLFKHRLKV